jgi:hypothetical protein
MTKEEYERRILELIHKKKQKIVASSLKASDPIVLEWLEGWRMGLLNAAEIVEFDAKEENI